MPSTATLSTTFDHMVVSPVNSDWVFNGHNGISPSLGNYDDDLMGQEEHASLPPITIQSTSIISREPYTVPTSSYNPTVDTITSLLSVDRQQQQQQQQQEEEYEDDYQEQPHYHRIYHYIPQSTSPPSSPPLWLGSSNTTDHLKLSTSSDHLPTFDSYYPLQFKIISHDGGCYSSNYDIQNVLRNDPSVYCSGRTGTVNISLRYLGGRNLMDTNCVLTKIIIRSPLQGFTAPCKEGLIFISHYPIDVEKTRRFDGFTKTDYDQYSSAAAVVDRDDHDPIAWFSASHRQRPQETIHINHRSGKYILIKLLRSEREQDNIDLQYIGFIGYSGPRSFASPPILY
ncbi:uncharacterized protein BX664DRAFT_324533 [Halteromyces radiatus]|uniref:uncharacterized protein n=1 Tax=Halteromyces radiatus TaxID=101107 RepID=UPI00221FB2F9|nr:uncharacterized protein BX664DRAFT_324533 [Halteromyces radiatus]KAI8096648.1 hypothetical protein BX664DRAFT_324533 [Halteromyces radiatus]